MGPRGPEHFRLAVFCHQVHFHSMAMTTVSNTSPRTIMGTLNCYAGWNFSCFQYLFGVPPRYESQDPVLTLRIMWLLSMDLEVAWLIDFTSVHLCEKRHRDSIASQRAHDRELMSVSRDSLVFHWYRKDCYFGCHHPRGFHSSLKILSVLMVRLAALDCSKRFLRVLL